MKAWDLEVGLDTTITFIIFLTLGSESALGNLNALFAFLGLVTSLLVKKYLKEKSNNKAFFISALSIVIVTLPIIFTNSFSVFILYNIIFNISYKITQILVDTLVYNVSNNKTLITYQLEYTYLHETIHSLGKTFSELILLIAIKYSFSLNSLQIVAAILSFTIFIQTLIYNKYCKKYTI